MSENILKDINKLFLILDFLDNNEKDNMRKVQLIHCFIINKINLLQKYLLRIKNHNIDVDESIFILILLFTNLHDHTMFLPVLNHLIEVYPKLSEKCKRVLNISITTSSLINLIIYRFKKDEIKTSYQLTQLPQDIRKYLK